MAAIEGPCIVCGATTSDKARTTGRFHWRCEDGEECAVRRNAKKARPKPEQEVRAAWKAAHR